MQELKITPEGGGWLFADLGDACLRIRLAHDDAKLLRRLAEVHLLEPTPDDLRRLPGRVNRVYAAATMRGATLIQLELRRRLVEPPPDLSTRPTADGAALQHRFRLSRPDGRRLEDDFYRDVAHAYQSAIAFGLSPRKAIVADTGAADATVAAWVMRARRDGHLPPAEPGKVSA